jgi:undecaprenyl pyrophosphate phosphatase UppP
MLMLNNIFLSYYCIAVIVICILGLLTYDKRDDAILNALVGVAISIPIVGAFHFLINIWN